MPTHKWTIVEGDGPQPTSQRGKYTALWEDLMLRLERTPARWLHVIAETPQEFKGLYDGLSRRARKSHGAVSVTARKKEQTVFVRRSPNWGQRERGVLAHVPADPGDAPASNNGGRKPTGRRPGHPPKAKAEVSDFD